MKVIYLSFFDSWLIPRCVILYFNSAQFLKWWLQIVGMNWVKLPAGKDIITAADSWRLHCQLEVNVRCLSFDPASFHICYLILPDMITLFLMCLKKFGQRLLLSGYWASTLNVQVEKESFQKHPNRSHRTSWSEQVPLLWRSVWWKKWPNEGFVGNRDTLRWFKADSWIH